MPTTDPDQMERLRRENPLAIPSERWDPHRLWLTAFKEDNKKVLMTGVGKTNDDVAEFLRRVSVSRYFKNVRLVKTEERQDRVGNLPPVTVTGFEMRAEVKY
jgi:type IV pilus assembly protein PilN